MAYIVAFAGWGGLVAFVVAAVVGENPRDTEQVLASIVFYILGPAVPVLVALWFNDWARDGFPSRADTAPGRLPAPAVTADANTGDTARTPPAEAAAGWPVVAAAPLGVPEHAGEPPAPAPGAYPVAPVLRDPR